MVESAALGSSGCSSKDCDSDDIDGETGAAYRWNRFSVDTSATGGSVISPFYPLPPSV